MEQTSVEWIESQLDFLDKYMSKDDILWFFNKAKEIHNIELGNAYEEGWKEASKNAMKEIHKYQ